MPSPAVRAVVSWLSDLATFSRLVMNRPLRPYQLEPARAVLNSILSGAGRTFAIQMARQAGKNELSAQMEAYLLNLYQRRGGQIVKASPTFKPQTVNSILRLTDRLENRWNRSRWRRREGYIVELGQARALFFSADLQANVVGATADLLLEGDEAQDIAHDKWFKDFRPMAASTNATTVLYGTAWTSDTLLAQTIDSLKRAEARDGRRRVYAYDADQVAAAVPAYGEYVRAEVERLGRDHPLIKTQYYLETVDAQAGLFPPRRRALMRGDHERRFEPEPGRCYALLIDVAGEDAGAGSGPIQRSFLSNPRRDATALTVVDVVSSLSSPLMLCAPEWDRDETAVPRSARNCQASAAEAAVVDAGNPLPASPRLGEEVCRRRNPADGWPTPTHLHTPAHGPTPGARTGPESLACPSTLQNRRQPVLRTRTEFALPPRAGEGRGGVSLPIYRVVDRGVWLGTPHAQLHGEILAFARHWRARWVVIDATGVGAGLASFLDRALPERVIPVVFSPKVKSDLGWAFVGVVETGRFKDYASHGASDDAPETRQFWYEVGACEFEVVAGPGERMRWGVREKPAYDGWIARGHDDLLISAALCAVLCAVLDKHVVPTTGASATIALDDTLEDIDRADW